MENKFDVIVIGGGFSGVAAALAAAREGMNVLLAEKSNCFGGAAVNCLVNPFMQFTTYGDEKLLSAGIFKTILEELAKENAYIHKKEHYFDEEVLKLVLNRMVINAGVTPLFHSYLTSAEVENGKIKSVVLSGKSGNIRFYADYFIDCTGDADLAVMAGCGYMLGRPEDNLCQPMTLCFRVGNVDTDAFWADYKRLNTIYKQQKAEGKIRNCREDILAFSTLVDNVIHFNSTRIVKLNPTDVFDLTKAEIEAREQAFELFKFIKANSESFKNASMISTASEIGIRESRMINGLYTITRDDLLNCRKFDDGIAACNYDIDIHNPEGSGTSHYLFAPGTYYTIPYRCLCPDKTTNLLVGGRCISADHAAQASLRIMPTVCTLGEAAGVGAAVAFKQKSGVADADIKTIQKILSQNNAVID